MEKEVTLDFIEDCREADFSETLAVGEGAVSDRGHTCWDGELGEFVASIEELTGDRGEVRGEFGGGQIFAASKRAIAKICDAFMEGDGLEIQTVFEAGVWNFGDLGRNGHGRDGVAMNKGMALQARERAREINGGGRPAIAEGGPADGSDPVGQSNLGEAGTLLEGLPPNPGHGEVLDGLGDNDFTFRSGPTVGDDDRRLVHHFVGQVAVRGGGGEGGEGQKEAKERHSSRDAAARVIGGISVHFVNTEIHRTG